MTAEIKLLNLSGTITGFIGSHAARVIFPTVAFDGRFLPLNVASTGRLIVSGDLDPP